MKRRHLIATGLTAGCLGIAVPAMAQDTQMRQQPPATGQQKQKISRQDRNFYEDALKAGFKEITLSQLALQRAQNPQVREFASTMISHHTQVNEQLREAGMNVDVKAPKYEDAQKITRKLSDKQGQEFDREYLSMMVKDHKDAVKKFEKEAQRGEYAGFKQLAQASLPILQNHLQAAQQLEQTIKQGGGMQQGGMQQPSGTQQGGMQQPSGTQPGMGGQQGGMQQPSGTQPGMGGQQQQGGMQQQGVQEGVQPQGQMGGGTQQ